MSGPAGEWLSIGAEVLVRKLEASSGEPFDCDVLIVGSGYGGAVAAARFAGTVVTDAGGAVRKARVFLLERGVEYVPGTFPSRFSEVPGHVRFSTQDGAPARGRAEALFDVRVGAHAHVMVGNGLGGGSLINAGVMERPTDEILASGWPATLDKAALDAGYSAALAMLAPQRLPQDIQLGKLASLEALARTDRAGDAQRCAIAVNFQPGYRTPAGVAMQSCTQCGDCVSGCNQRAKLTLDTNYLALARQRGAELFCGATVERIARVSADGIDHWRVDWHFTEASRRPPDQQALHIRAAKVVLAAGTLGSTEILLRSERDGLALSSCLGRRFSTNGDMIAAVSGQHACVNGCADENRDPSDREARNVGPTITALVRREVEGTAFAVQEFGIPAALRRVFGEVIATADLLNSSGLPPPTPRAGDDPMAVTKNALTHTCVYGLMGDDGAGGKLVLAGASGDGEQGSFCDGQVAISWKDVDSLPLFKRQFDWLSRAAARGPGGKALPNPLWRPLGVAEKFEELSSGVVATVHPLGGCAMGDSVKDGVVDAHGRVFQADGSLHEGLAVLDGAIVPRALAINPALTIAALAEQACVSLRSHWGLKDESAKLPPLAPRPARVRRHAREKTRTSVVLAEQFQGPLHLDGVRYWARLRLHAPIADLPKFVRVLPRRVEIESGTLTLTPVDSAHDEFSEPPTDTEGVICAKLAGHVALFEPGDTLWPVARHLRYEMTIASLDVDEKKAGGLRVGTAIVGRKKIDWSDTDLSPWCELAQLEVVVADARASKDLPEPTIWRLDLAHMARFGRLMLTLKKQANAPEALADLAALALMVLRVLLVNGRLLDLGAGQRETPSHVGERYPGPVAGVDSEIVWVHPELANKGARLTHYKAPAAAGASRPVLMIHGFGASGSTFAHQSIPGNLASFMLARQRDVWVLDLRTSIANETDGDGGKVGRACTFEEVALGDIPRALQIVHEHSAGRKVDIVAHCIGSAMFCVAALESARPGGNVLRPMRPMIGAVVLSQVGPLVELSPMNQLRGFVASYIEQFLGVETFDTRPPPSTTQALVDMALAFFPYPPDDDEAARAAGMEHDFRPVRHRADAIFGQLMELANVGDDTLTALDAIYGWVKVRSLAQTIHFARHRMLTDASGRNAALVRQFFDNGFDFPVLMVHGRRNRVFDWRGSLESLRLLSKLRRRAEPPPVDEGDAIRWMADDSTQLLVVKKYGHQDCVIGKDAHSDVFPHMHAFLERHAASEEAHKGPPGAPPVACETPWIGPMLGWTRFESADVLSVSLLLHASPRHARTLGIAFVPLRKATNDDTRWEPIVHLAAGYLVDDIIGSPGAPKPDKNLSSQIGALSPASNELLGHGLHLRIRRSWLDGKLHHIAVLTVHSDLPLSPDEVFRERITGVGLAGPWLEGGRRLGDRVAAEVEAFFKNVAAEDRRVDFSIMSIQPEVVAAADATKPEYLGQPGGSTPRSLRFVLASCQYPPGLLDEECAEAAYRRLASALHDERPQFLVLAGDQVYLDATAGLFDPAPAGSAAGVDKAYELNYRLPEFRRVAAQLPIYSMLDDHEVRDDWQPEEREPADVVTALAAYDTYQAKIQPPPLLKGARHYRFDPASHPFFVLDTRSERQLRRVHSEGRGEPLESARIVTDRSMARLQAWLGSLPDEAVKFIVSPTPVLPLERYDDGPHPGERLAERLRSDGWSGYPHSLRALLEYVDRRAIQRVVFLSGDAHLSLATKVLLHSGSNAIYSVVSSGLYAPWPFANGKPEDFILEGAVTLPGAGIAFGTMHTAPLPPAGGYALVGVTYSASGAPSLVVDFHGSDGSSRSFRHDLSSPGGEWSCMPTLVG